MFQILCRKLEMYMRISMKFIVYMCVCVSVCNNSFSARNKYKFLCRKYNKSPLVYYKKKSRNKTKKHTHTFFFLIQFLVFTVMLFFLYILFFCVVYFHHLWDISFCNRRQRTFLVLFFFFLFILYCLCICARIIWMVKNLKGSSLDIFFLVQMPSLIQTILNRQNDNMKNVPPPTKL